jgi:hypothetical protein
MPILVPLQSTALQPTASQPVVTHQSENKMSSLSENTYADGPLGPNFSSPKYDMGSLQPATPSTQSSYEMIANQKRQQAMTREYFNHAFGKYSVNHSGIENVVDTYPKSIMDGQSIARQLADEYLNKNEWDNFHIFTQNDDEIENDRRKQLFLDNFIEKIKPYERTYTMRVHENPNDPNIKSTLLREFNRIYSECLEEAGLPVTLRDGTNRMMNSEYAKTQRIQKMTEAANPVPDLKPEPPEQKSWWHLWGGRKTARNFIRSRNGKKTSTHNLKRRSSKHMVRHRKSKRVHHTRRKQTRRHRHRHSRHRR